MYQLTLRWPTKYSGDDPIYYIIRISLAWHCKFYMQISIVIICYFSKALTQSLKSQLGKKEAKKSSLLKVKSGIRTQWENLEKALKRKKRERKTLRNISHYIAIVHTGWVTRNGVLVQRPNRKTKDRIRLDNSLTW